MAEQIKQINNSLDCIVVRVSVPQPGVDEGEQIREITEKEEENIRAVNLNAYAC